ncbi:unnamed protein product [Calypogeia fissa]
MTSEGTSNWRDEIDPQDATDGKRSCCQDGQHEDVPSAVHGDAHDSPGKMLIQSVTEILTQSAQSVKALVSGSGSPVSPEESGEEKTLLQSVGEKIMQSAQSVKEVVSGSSDSSDSGDGNVVGHEEEKTLVQSVQERIAQTTQSVKEAITGAIAEEDVEEKGVLQAVGEKIVQSAKTVKDAVKGDVHIIPGDDETAELSILVHTILD